MLCVTVKIILLTICSSLIFFIIRIPCTATKADKVRSGYFFDNYINVLLYALIIPSLVLPILGEGVALIAMSFPDPNFNMLSNICSQPSSVNLKELSYPFLLASVLTITGASMRLLCYHKLGKYFTYEMTIRPGHKLVDSGPYGIVRHPSYSTAYILYLGLSLFAFHPQNNIHLCDWNTTLSTLVHTLLYIWACMAIYVILGTILRIPIEEENLHRHFGKEWDDYTRRVPYKLIPGVY